MGEYVVASTSTSLLFLNGTVGLSCFWNIKLIEIAEVFQAAIERPALDDKADQGRSKDEDQGDIKNIIHFVYANSLWRLVAAVSID